MYRLNGDNIDYNEVSRYQRSSAGNKSQHFFQYYAVKDRINFTHLSTIPPDVSALSKNELCQSMLPSVDDDVAIKHNITCLVARVLCEYVPFFKHTYGVVERHIKHEYYKRMSSKSEVVCYKYVAQYNYIERGRVSYYSVQLLGRAITSIASVHYVNCEIPHCMNTELLHYGI